MSDNTNEKGVTASDVDCYIVTIMVTFNILNILKN